MSQPEPHSPGRTGIYGAFAFASVILTCFLQFIIARRIESPDWRMWLTFGLGAVYATLGVLHTSIIGRCDRRMSVALYAFMTAVVTALVYISPAKGFFGIIVLPMVSMAIFEFTSGWAAAVGLYLFAASIGVFWQEFGFRAIPEAIMSYLAAFAFTTVFTVIAKQALDAREREEALRHELEAANQRLREHAAQAEDLATTRERNRLAREIHDGVGHYLTVVKTQLDAAVALIPTQPDKAREAIAKAANLAGEALDDVRRSVGALRTDAVRPPLPAAIQELAVHGAPVPAVTIEGTPRPLASAVEHALFRTTQEGLTNIRKHARATRARVLLDFRLAGHVRLELSDDGPGIPPGPAPTVGFGLIGLRERIELLGGRVESGNRAAGGFALTIEVPA